MAGNFDVQMPVWLDSHGLAYLSHAFGVMQSFVGHPGRVPAKIVSA